MIIKLSKGDDPYTIVADYVVGLLSRRYNVQDWAVAHASSDVIVALKLKYDCEKEFEPECRAILLLGSYENNHTWSWDWDEGQTEIEVLGIAPIDEVTMLYGVE